MTTKSYLKNRFLTGWGWFATAWGFCVVAWSVGIIARVIVGPVAWVRFVWYGGLDGAAVILTVLAASGIGHFVIRLRQRL